MPGRPKLYLRSYPIPNGMGAHATAMEEDGWEGLLFTDTQNMSMDDFASLYLAASATSRGLSWVPRLRVLESTNRPNPMFRAELSMSGSERFELTKA